VIGPSFYIHPPTQITYTPVDAQYNSSTSGRLLNPLDSACWTAFRAHQYILPQDVTNLASEYHYSDLGNATTFLAVEVRYDPNCTAYLDNVDVSTALSEVYFTNPLLYANLTYTPLEHLYDNYEIENCFMGTDVYCNLSDPQTKQCRMNVRMQAAFILTGCLIIKAIYMIITNFRARNQVKTHCLTFGDVIVASVLDPDLKIKNECLLNSGDGHRHKVAHTCHKHCKDHIPSMTGDTIGHCQKCNKFNDRDMSADLPHPSIAIKYKRSLLSNLGSTAIVQMIILMICSLGMIATSIMLIIYMTSYAQQYHFSCSPRNPFAHEDYCTQGVSKYLATNFGTWGGFSSSAALTSLQADSLGSEFLAFTISNGAQFLYSLLYMLLIYNLSLVSMEQEWGKWETDRKRPRCTIVSGKQFEQSYFLQLPPRVLLPLMSFAALMHWLLGQAISTVETIYTDPDHGIEHSIYFVRQSFCPEKFTNKLTQVTYAAYPIFLSTVLMVAMTAVCWWAFTYTREGFIPQMYGSIRAACASTTELTDFTKEGILWGDRKFL